MQAIDTTRWLSLGDWVVEECPERPDEPSPLFRCHQNTDQVVRVHNELCAEIERLREREHALIRAKDVDLDDLRDVVGSVTRCNDELQKQIEWLDRRVAEERARAVAAENELERVSDRVNSAYAAGQGAEMARILHALRNVNDTGAAAAANWIETFCAVPMSDPVAADRPVVSSPVQVDGETDGVVRAICSGGGPSRTPGKVLIEFQVDEGTARRLGSEWLLRPIVEASS